MDALAAAAEAHGAEFVADRADALARVWPPRLLTTAVVRVRPVNTLLPALTACSASDPKYCERDAGGAHIDSDQTQSCQASAVRGPANFLAFQDYNRRLREEQDAEFQQSLEADRQREAAAAAEAEQRRAAIEEEARADADARSAALLTCCSSLPPSCLSCDQGTVEIYIICAAAVNGAVPSEADASQHCCSVIVAVSATTAEGCCPYRGQCQVSTAGANTMPLSLLP